MYKLFIFSVPELNYTKKDLNVAQSKNRRYIGLLARMVTNAIFLSHALRKNITIRIFVQKIIPHIIQIQSETIRYLGPEERSLASLLLKAETVFKEEIAHGFISKDSTSWLEPNPGILVRVTENPLVNIEEFLEPPQTIVKIDSLTGNSHSTVEKTGNQKLSLKVFEEQLLTIAENYSSLIFPFDLSFLDNNQGKESSSKEKRNRSDPFQEYSLSLRKKIAPAQLVTIINLILDKLEKKE
ncbi:MAG: hypothetical protein GF308_12470 [Candidatus Heimdallarchaeota archaeon]|nr:hypothetical protein [Candidatus Heimdallarchaeota archaeon]